MNRRMLFGTPLLMLACGATEADARAHLESEGMTVTKLEKKAGVFSYTAKKGDDICTGTLSIKKGLGSTQQSLTTFCERDTSACKPGAAAVCVNLAEELYRQQAKVFPTRAAEMYRTACTDKHAHACARAGEFEEIDKNWDKVREFSQQGCDLGDGEACARLSKTESDGLGTEKNPEAALELAKKACEKLSMRGCRAAAGVLLDKEPGDPAAAVPLAQKACTAKFDDGCFVLGVALFRAKKDYAAALGHLAASCDDAAFSKRGMACNLAGAICFDGLGMKKDAARGAGLFETACAAEHADGCTNAAMAYRKGSGVGRDAEKAAEFSAKACKLGDKSACAK